MTSWYGHDKYRQRARQGEGRERSSLPLGPPLGPPVRAVVSGKRPRTARDAFRLAPELVAARFDTLTAAAGGCDALLATGLMPAGARDVAEKLGIRYVFACCDIFGLPSPHHPPGARPGTPSPREETDLKVLWEQDAQRVNALYGEALNRHRAGLGPAPVDDVRDHVLTDQPWPAADPVLGPWQELTDLDLVQTGAWILPDDRPLPERLEAFLDTGAPPVYVGFGSMAAHAPKDARVAVEASRAQGRRALLARGWVDLAPIDDVDLRLPVRRPHRGPHPRDTCTGEGRGRHDPHRRGHGGRASAARHGQAQLACPQGDFVARQAAASYDHDDPPDRATNRGPSRRRRSRLALLPGRHARAPGAPTAAGRCVVTVQRVSDSSRDTAQGAGWGSAEPGAYKQLMPHHVEKLSWLNPRTLWAARNGVLASWFGDPTGRTRSHWVARRAAAGAPGDKVIRRDGTDAFSFMVIGDTGEGDDSQYAVVPGFLKISQDTDFAVIASDVIYPVGSARDYGDKFFRPYQDYPAPIYAIPGNHDWYEDLGAFMRVFCADTPPLDPEPRPRPLSRAWWRALLWHRPGPTDEQRLAAARALRSAPGQQAAQPGPYWAIDAGPVRIVGIDTGLLGTIDAEQGAWLREVSRDPKPKILITGSPLYVDGEHHPCAIEGGGTVDEIVRDPDHHYVAAIGGDIHNYQRYPVDVDGRTIQYVVAGGGGAFMHATHTIPRVSVGGVTERDFRCYPLRGDSLAFYSHLYGRRLRLPRLLDLTEAEAIAVVAERLGIEPGRKPDPDARVTRRTRLVASLLGTGGRPDRTSRFRLPVRKAYTQLFSPGSATYSPPFFKCFLRLDVAPEAVRLRCFAATGNRAQEVDPPVEDEVVIPLK